MMKQAVLTTVLTLTCVLHAGAEIIDRILATVGGTLVLQSDAVAAVKLGFVQVPQDHPDPLQFALDRLIERRLMLLEVDRYGPPEPDRVEIDARMAELDKRFAGQQLDAILREVGLSVGQLRGHVRDELRLDAYLRQRFASTFQATEEEVLRYYQDHQPEFTVEGKVLPFANVSEHARQAVIEQRRVAAIREWMAGLRRRTEVNVIYLPGR